MEPIEFKISDVEVHLSQTKLGKLHDALTAKYMKDGVLVPSERAKADIALLLSTAFTKVADHWEGVKAASLERLGKLQLKALEFYRSALGGENFNIEHLKTILRDLNKEVRTIAEDAQKMADEHPPLLENTSVDPTSGRTTTTLNGGADAGGATYFKGPNEAPSGEVAVQGPHPGRRKENLPEVPNALAEDHRGHAAPEGAVDNPELVNRLENLAGETPSSNLGPKKRFDNLVSRIAGALRGHAVKVAFRRIMEPGNPRPVATHLQIVVDGVTLYTVTIPNV